jgi:hypothetical protein
MYHDLVYHRMAGKRSQRAQQHGHTRDRSELFGFATQPLASSRSGNEHTDFRLRGHRSVARCGR